jgi:hypothetical protein
MSAAAIALPPVYSEFDDRSVGAEGTVLREVLDDARDPVDRRGEEIFNRLETALRKANDENGTLISPKAFRRAVDFIAMLPPDIPVPEVVVENDSELGLDWDEGSGQVLSLTIRDTPFVGFAAMFGLEPLYGRVALVSGIPEILALLLRRLYPNAVGRHSFPHF